MTVRLGLAAIAVAPQLLAVRPVPVVLDDAGDAQLDRAPPPFVPSASITTASPFSSVIRPAYVTTAGSSCRGGGAPRCADVADRAGQQVEASGRGCGRGVGEQRRACSR